MCVLISGNVGWFPVERARLMTGGLSEVCIISSLLRSQCEARLCSDGTTAI